MLEVTPQERLALAVTALLLAAGAGARVLSDAELLRGSAIAVMAGDSVSAAPRAATEEALAEERIRRAPLAPGERLDPNTASALELQRLPRVGPALAGRIVAHREANGAFRTLADLDAVPGVGPAMLAALEPLLTLPPAPPRLPPATGAREPGSRPGRSTESRDPFARVDVNRADALELQTLPGIGPALAARIVEWRAANGPFRRASDLEKVRGIGPGMRERLESRVRFDP